MERFANLLMFHPDPHHQPYLHPNVPVSQAEDLDSPHWQVLSLNEPVKSWYQVFVFQPKPKWRLTSWWTCQGLVHDGRASYRVPKSAKAWLTILWPYTVKLWKGVWSGEIFEYQAKARQAKEKPTKVI